MGIGSFVSDWVVPAVKDYFTYGGYSMSGGQSGYGDALDSTFGIDRSGGSSVGASMSSGLDIGKDEPKFDYDILLGAGLDFASAYARDKYISQPAADRAYDQSLKGSELAFQRTYGAYKRRYQDTVEDLKKAGLNPILAASGGFKVSGSPTMQAPTGFMAQTQDINFTNSALNVAKTKKADEELNLISAKTNEALANAAAQQAKAGQLNEETKLTVERVLKTKRECELIASQRDLKKKEKEVLIQKLRQINYDLVQLKKVSEIYDTPTGTGLLWIKSFMDALGLPLTLLTGIGAMSKKPKISKIKPEDYVK